MGGRAAWSGFSKLWYNNISIMLKVVLTRLVYDRLVYEQAQ